MEVSSQALYAYSVRSDYISGREGEKMKMVSEKEISSLFSEFAYDETRKGVLGCYCEEGLACLL